MAASLKLTFRPASVLELGGRKYRLNLAFDNVLRVFEVNRNELFAPNERQALMLDLLVGAPARRLNAEKQAALLRAIMDDFIARDDGAKTGGGGRILDFTQDAPYIYASFAMAYGVDLYAEMGRMDWRVFVALFQGLPDDAKIKEIMRIRKRPVPAQTKNNKAEIDALLEAKAFYALRVTDREAESDFQAGVDRLADSLIHRARAGGNNGR